MDAKTLQQLNDAKAHLSVAILQSLPSDDQIIMDHVRDALALVREVVATVSYDVIVGVQ